MTENTPEEQPVHPSEPESAHSTRQWRACCLAPTVALGLILIVVVAAGLFSPQPGQEDRAVVQEEVDPERREAFVAFGQTYFGIAKKADEVNERAFAEMEALAQGSGSIGRVHEVFLEAARANEVAVEDFKGIQIPGNLLSREKIRQSSDLMSQSYEQRRLACMTLAEWNGDFDDQQTAQEFGVRVEQVNRLTVEGLTQLADAARDNGLTDSDLDRMVPASLMDAARMWMGISPWRMR